MAILETRVEHVSQDESSASCEEGQDIRWLFPSLWWKTGPILLHKGGAYFTKCSVPEYSSPRLGGHVSTNGCLASTVREQRSKVVLSSVSLCTWSWIKTHGTGPSQWRWVLPPQLIKPRNTLTDMFILVSEVLIDPVELTMMTIAVAFGLSWGTGETWAALGKQGSSETSVSWEWCLGVLRWLGYYQGTGTMQFLPCLP